MIGRRFHKRMKDASSKKKALAAVFLLCGVFSLLFSACGKQEKAQSGKAFDIYYLNREETKIVKEVFYIDSQDPESQIRQLISALEATPEDVSLKSPVDYQLSGGGRRTAGSGRG